MPGPGSTAPTWSEPKDFDAFARQVFGDSLQEWLDTPHPMLDGQKPGRVLGQPGGEVAVRDLLRGIIAGAA
jgi:uncharacterized protein (DUF2384 family)